MPDWPHTHRGGVKASVLAVLNPPSTLKLGCLPTRLKSTYSRCVWPGENSKFLNGNEPENFLCQSLCCFSFVCRGRFQNHVKSRRFLEVFHLAFYLHGDTWLIFCFEDCGKTETVMLKTTNSISSHGTGQRKRKCSSLLSYFAPWDGRRWVLKQWIGKWSWSFPIEVG